MRNSKRLLRQLSVVLVSVGAVVSCTKTKTDFVYKMRPSSGNPGHSGNSDVSMFGGRPIPEDDIMNEKADASYAFSTVSVGGLGLNDTEFGNNCTGVAIGRRVVLTAGHCGADYVMFGANPSVLYREHRDWAEASYLYKVQTRIDAPGFISNEETPNLDFRLLILEKDFMDPDGAPYIRPATLLPENHNWKELNAARRASVQVAGYGANDETGFEGKGILRFGTLGKNCYVMGPNVPENPSVACDKNPGLPVYVRSGDSGGPVFYQGYDFGAPFQNYVAAMSYSEACLNGDCRYSGVLDLTNPWIRAHLRRMAAQGGVTINGL